MNVSLRDYQMNGIDEIINAWTDCRGILFQVPTGTGKVEIVSKF